ncbi:hypothetical protein QBC37DRAFT_429850 [Rhypophila decipiens]|uniref:Uncharacterized protein n=1 Tax=Rhypophila decipiens TaxID=261697 RepID=A0AAN6Y5J3_9PEZI|nr:hypothetical protein QBC37DRAFT_429850 [Rhypophila decipiens]
MTGPFLCWSILYFFLSIFMERRCRYYNQPYPTIFVTLSKVLRIVEGTLFIYFFGFLFWSSILYLYIYIFDILAHQGVSCSEFIFNYWTGRQAVRREGFGLVTYLSMISFHIPIYVCAFWTLYFLMGWGQMVELMVAILVWDN